MTLHRGIDRVSAPQILGAHEFLTNLQSLYGHPDSQQPIFKRVPGLDVIRRFESVENQDNKFSKWFANLALLDPGRALPIGKSRRHDRAHVPA